VPAGQIQSEKRHQQGSDVPGEEADHLAIGKFFFSVYVWYATARMVQVNKIMFVLKTE
jgi:hypothetical protein